MYTIDINLKIEILITSLVVREREILDYQINIDSYEKAITLAGDDPDLSGRVVQLEELLVTEKGEQKFSQLMLDALEAQLETLGADVSKLAIAKAAEMKAEADNLS